MGEEIDLTYEGIATNMPMNTYPYFTTSEEIDLTYEGIATPIVWAFEAPMREEIDLTYEGIATRLGSIVLKIFPKEEIDRVRLRDVHN